MEQLQVKINELERKISDLENLIQSHTHDGVRSQQVQFDDLSNTIMGVSTSAELTARTTGVPLVVATQIFIDSSNTPKRLYIFDVVSKTWYYATLT